jgi:hypothetical protein
MMFSCGIENRGQQAGARDISGMVHRSKGRDCPTIPIARDTRLSYGAAAMEIMMHQSMSATCSTATFIELCVIEHCCIAVNDERSLIE